MDKEAEYRNVRNAALRLASLSDEERSAMLLKMAAAFEENKERIFRANREDIEKAGKDGISNALLHRLVLDESKLASAIEGVKSVASQKCPLHEVREKRLLDEGLVLEKVTFPLGVIGMVFEARPDALIQIVSLAIKSANGIILKGGKEASLTNSTLYEIIRETLDGAGSVMLLSSHSDVDTMLKMEGYIDLIIPRGSNKFVRYCMDNTHIPVMGHADGICTVYVDSCADMDTAVNVCTDSKVQYPAACNAAETILVHKDAAETFIPLFASSLEQYGVTIHADERSLPLLKDYSGKVMKACEDDFHMEFLSLELALKVVDSIDEAICHIAKHSSHHTDAIVTCDDTNRERFFNEVDSADVFSNCSTRFADGYRFGLGAEVGISTGKLHARGPVGLEGLTTTKWLLSGNGQIVRSYTGKDARHFIHKDLLP